MQAIPASRQVKLDFTHWRNDRLLAHYQPIRPWCELILGEQIPLAVQGQSKGISLLFPMERLFEQHVARTLKQQLPRQYIFVPRRRVNTSAVMTIKICSG
jgi:5-methylcytosine-specific restriction enzyme subunit McrC